MPSLYVLITYLLLLTSLFVCVWWRLHLLFAGSLRKLGLAVLLMNLAAFVGIEVSAYRKMSEASRSANHPSNTSVSISHHSLLFPKKKNRLACCQLTCTLFCA
jgi:hypothetical protein